MTDLPDGAPELPGGPRLLQPSRDRWALADVEPSTGVDRGDRGLTWGYATGWGAVRGGKAGCVYALLLTGLGSIAALTTFRGSPAELGDGAAFALVVLLYVLLVAVPVGTVLGGLFGLAFVPLARRGRPRTRVVMSGLVVGAMTCAGLSFLFASGEGFAGHETGFWTGLIALAVLPALVAGLAAARHMRDLSRLAAHAQRPTASPCR